MRRVDKFRGSRTHGRGKKAGRGAGKRGGKGNAGLHKHKFTWTIRYDPDHFGRHGFKRPQKLVAKGHVRTLNIRDVSIIANGEGLAEIDLTARGFQKLLGTGKIEKPLTVIVAAASPTAVKKIENAGGKVVMPEE